jgi:NAD-dependent deacetylase
MLDVLIRKIRDARRITVMTGAGVSAASGVPTFRGPAGLWRQYRPSDLATPEAFARDPRLVWEWYAWRRERIASCEPNRAHHVLAAWTMRMPGCQLVTQNVDDLHVRAGSERLIRLHGSIWELACWTGCGGEPRRWRDERVPLTDRLPRCVHCGGLARPAVVWFGEALDESTVVAATGATACDVFLTVGTSALVYPAAGLVHEAKGRGAFTAEINLEETPATSIVDLAIQAPAEDALHAIEAALGGT